MKLFKLIRQWEDPSDAFIVVSRYPVKWYTDRGTITGTYSGYNAHRPASFKTVIGINVAQRPFVINFGGYA
jgi:hypothetical protein